MMLLGKVYREGIGWTALCHAVGVYMQGRTRKEATDTLADAIRVQCRRDGMTVQVTDLEGEDVLITSNDFAGLAAEVLRVQREVSKLSLADVAKKLGASSRNAYALYERGEREPSISKFVELLGAVAPELMLVVGERKPAKAAVASVKGKKAAR